MKSNPAGQRISNLQWTQTNNMWLVNHGFPTHAQTSNVIQGFTPTVYNNMNNQIPTHMIYTVGQGQPPTEPQPQAIPVHGAGGGLGGGAGGGGAMTIQWDTGTAMLQPQPVTVSPLTASELQQLQGVMNPTIHGEYAQYKMKKNKNKVYNLVLSSFKRFKGGPKKGEVGIEIECEGKNLVTAMVDYWLVHQDNSLRPVGDHMPQEYVLREPLSRKDVPKALSYLCKKLKEAGSEPVYSHRTSVHVHLNCQTLTIKQIYQIWCLYTIFEEILIDFSGPDRPGNLFCLGSKQAEYQVFTLQNALISEDFNEVFNDNLRYTSCNMASLGKFGSMEFRSMRGTTDQGLIQSWVDILCILKDKALEYENPQEIVRDFQRLNAIPFMKKVFSEREDILQTFNQSHDLHKRLWDGLRLMRDVAMAVEWEKPVPEEKKSPLEPESNPVFTNTGLGYYTKPVTDEDLNDLETFFGENASETADYWVVNTTGAFLQIPRYISNYTPNGTWALSADHKALFRVDHNYMGQMPATPEEINLG